MSSRLLKVCASLLLLAAIAFVLLSHLSETVYWKLESQQASRDGEYLLYQYRYQSDQDRHAPYGQYIFIKPKYSNKKAIDSHLIFAGYCQNEKLYRWLSPQNLEIKCISNEADPIKTQANKAYSIDIKVIKQKTAGMKS